MYKLFEACRSILEACWKLVGALLDACYSILEVCWKLAGAIIDSCRTIAGLVLDAYWKLKTKSAIDGRSSAADAWRSHRQA
ncbi:MAG: hypothetical protein LBT62_03190, partial [Deltaproteobacteria bacterium]|nr:hypothetical protein [Deltaproteobacteria bacterium]